MPLKLRPTGLASPIDKDRGDFIVFSGEWAMGRIYEERGSRQHLRWYWSLLGIVGKPLELRRTDGRAPTLEAAKAEIQASWKRWLEWAGLEEAPST
jgi:hypothetical protein